MPTKIADDFTFVGTLAELKSMLGDSNRRIGDNAVVLLVDADPTSEHRERMAIAAATIRHGQLGQVFLSPGSGE